MRDLVLAAEHRVQLHVTPVSLETTGNNLCESEDNVEGSATLSAGAAR